MMVRVPPGGGDTEDGLVGGASRGAVVVEKRDRNSATSHGDMPLGALCEARQRGEDQAQFLAEQERAALLGELLGRRR